MKLQNPSQIGLVMADYQKMLHCRRCRRHTVHLGERPNGVLHLLLTIVTAGIWLLVWIGLTVFQGKARCTECGTKPGLFRGY